MPEAATMILLYGKGGHLSTEEYSIVLVRAADGAWRGTAVGRSRIWIKDAPYTPMKRAEWALDTAAGRQLDDAISHRCRAGRKPAAKPAPKPADVGPPPLGLIAERVDVVRRGRAPVTFYADAGGGGIAGLMRPPL